MTKYCPNCKIEVESGKFCPECGSKLEDLPAEMYCPSCGKVYDHGKFCPDCGVKLKERSLKKESSSGVVVSPEESSSSIECPACGFQNAAGATVCANCGFPLKSEISIDSTPGASVDTSSEDDAILAKFSDEYGDMRGLNDEEAPLAIEEIRRLAEKGNPQAECFLGYLYVDGKYIEQDSKKAYDLICDAERKGYGLASAYKGIFYMQGLVVEQDLAEAERLFDAALHIPGVMFLKGMLCTMRDDMTESIKWVKMAAEKGDDAGLCYMGHAYMNGIGDTPQDPVKAFEYYNESAALGNPEAENMLGVCYQNGQGTEPNDEQALYWYQEAVKHNDSDAQNNLANCYKYGWLGLEEDPEKAFELYKKAAEQDNVDAMFEVAKYYDASYLTSKKSVEWYQKAADAGHGDAMYELAQKYENGWDVETDPSKAKEYYEKAAEAGNDRAIAKIEKKDESVTEDREQLISSIVSSLYQHQYSKSYSPYSSGYFTITTGDIFKSMPGGRNLETTIENGEEKRKVKIKVLRIDDDKKIDWASGLFKTQKGIIIHTEMDILDPVVSQYIPDGELSITADDGLKLIAFLVNKDKEPVKVAYYDREGIGYLWESFILFNARCAVDIPYSHFENKKVFLPESSNYYILLKLFRKCSGNKELLDELCVGPIRWDHIRTYSKL